MIADIDIWRAANLIIQNHGDNAPVVAAQRADGLLSQGDPAGHRTWKRIAKAIDELRRERPAMGEPIN